MAVAGLAAPAMAHAKSSDTTQMRHFEVRRDHPDVRVPIVVRASGEALIDLNAAAPGTDWSGAALRAGCLWT
jgi:hypothetical protein